MSVPTIMNENQQLIQSAQLDKPVLPVIIQTPTGLPPSGLPPSGLPPSNFPPGKIPESVSQNQLSKLNQLEQPISQPASSQPIYNLEYIFNKIKDIGRQVQLIRIERRGIIYGNKLWELLGKILGESEINSDLVAELKNYEFNAPVLNSIEKRILSIDNPNPDAYPDYYMNNIVKLYNQTNGSDINMVSLMHMGLDIGQLEYIIYKYMVRPVAPCYVAKKYDDKMFINILSIIQNLGRSFKTAFANELPEDKILFPQLIIKYVRELFEKNGSELISQMSKYKISRDKIKLFFEVSLDDDLHNADDFNIFAEDTLGERVYKVAYKYLRDDFNNGVNDYLLSISYTILFTMLDLYDYDKLHLPIDMIIELMFYSGALLGSIGMGPELKPTTFFENMVIFDDMSINKLFNISSYFESNNKIPNEQIVGLLDKIHKKITTNKFTISSNKIDIIEEHVKYIPVETTQLFCLIKPKATSDVESLVAKLNEMIFTFSNPLPQNIDNLFNKLKESVSLDDLPIITSIITPDNDLDILGIDESAYDELSVETGPTSSPESGPSPESDPTSGLEAGPLGESEQVSQSPQSAGYSYKIKYLKYKQKYLSLKTK
jgi:hypothetical protein